MERENLLTLTEVRVLGSLLEKKLATPEYYPLSMVSLLAACNQKTNRDPVVHYNEETAVQAIESLIEKKLARISRVSRVLKYEELFDDERKFMRREAAVLCVLLLRGAQTTGEIKARTHRLYRFEQLEEVDGTLDILVDSDLVVRISRRPGQKEARYNHLLSGMPETQNETDSSKDALSPGLSPPVDTDRLDTLEEKVASLDSELETLKQEYLEFKRQFE